MDTKDLAERAKQGDMKAGKALIAECRRGMVKPYWEKPEPVTEEVIAAHLERRKKASGRSFK